MQMLEQRLENGRQEMAEQAQLLEELRAQLQEKDQEIAQLTEQQMRRRQLMLNSPRSGSPAPPFPAAGYSWAVALDSLKLLGSSIEEMLSEGASGVAWALLPPHRLFTLHLPCFFSP